MDNALIGILGILLGIALNEYFRRRNRIENYSQKIFEKRFQVYGDLYELVDKSYIQINNYIIDESLTFEERYNGGFEEGLKIMEYCTEKQFYLSEELVVLIGGALVNTSTIFESDDEKEIEEETAKFRLDIRDIKEMILKESGIYEINKHFKSVGNVKYDAPIIDYYQKLKQQYKRK